MFISIKWCKWLGVQRGDNGKEYRETVIGQQYKEVLMVSSKDRS